MDKLQASDKKLVLIAAWLFFAFLIAGGGLQPGKEPMPGFHPPYPFVAVLLCWGMLAGLLFALFKALEPRPEHSSKMLRALLNTGLVVFLLLLALLGTGTDLPGYIPPLSLFAVFALLILLARGLYSGFSRVARFARGKP
jgi:peptidoglycan/LPS O-acetylase OafA/YrhL